MPEPCRQAVSACCRLAAGPSNTLCDLATSGKITDLGGDIERLALLGTQLESALITTRNTAAVIAARGGYAGLQPSDRRFSVSAKRANLRYAHGASVRLARHEGGALSLVAADHGGQIQHRVDATTDYDNRILRSLEASPFDQFPGPVPQAGNVLSLAAIRTARNCWDRDIAADHLNGFLMDRGRTRRSCLRHLGQNRAWRVPPYALAGLLEHLAHTGRNFVRVVCAEGLMQAQSGRVLRCNLQGTSVICESDHNSFALNIQQVAEVWVTAGRLHWQVEAYDTQGQGVAILTAPPMSCGPDWRAALMAMPRL